MCAAVENVRPSQRFPSLPPQEELWWRCPAAGPWSERQVSPGGHRLLRAEAELARWRRGAVTKLNSETITKWVVLWRTCKQLRFHLKLSLTSISWHERHAAWSHVPLQVEFQTLAGARSSAGRELKCSQPCGAQEGHFVFKDTATEQTKKTTRVQSSWFD